ncbi:hypothetical protein HMPREF0591_1420 [Mycobacterium parascrofulaceum ATCC BAA-614]|uniref:Uncharacterized protein n=1 Tax=Mycobacterium parascrofulaceum ATCC BAA-614 TaxID=525368 RepID=D5P5H6_9MYCO|nr:hypothetical protein HMPREF0591_1420 [Mycobacterium parascrofulaceum ATCC BAA-614]
MAAASGPPPEVVRQRLLSILSTASPAPTTRDLRRCLAAAFGRDFVHEHVYHNRVVLERRGEVTRVARTAAGGRHTRWTLGTVGAAADR